ncbi:MAG: hypothetical protein EOP51_01635 [Sphingobacteriales bacterium]|nr:MAG: hypothetical protein EOP51_01635 [Sphingobacteriales bacterium]
MKYYISLILVILIVACNKSAQPVIPPPEPVKFDSLTLISKQYVCARDLDLFSEDTTQHDTTYNLIISLQYLPDSQTILYSFPDSPQRKLTHIAKDFLGNKILISARDSGYTGKPLDCAGFLIQYFIAEDSVYIYDHNYCNYGDKGYNAFVYGKAKK